MTQSLGYSVMIAMKSLGHSLMIEPARIGGHGEADAMQCRRIDVVCADKRIGAH